MLIQVIRDQGAPMRHEVRIGATVFTVDASIAEGGQGSGPTPHDLYDAALGACEALTVLWYARHKAIPVEGIEVLVKRDASEERTGTYRLDTKLRLSRNLSDEQRQELLSAASKCPVHKLMTSVQTVIDTSLIE
jgi:putative redox protein